MKLFLAILFLVLIILCICAFMSFLFLILIPSLKNQKVNADDPLFSEEEMRIQASNMDFEIEENVIRVEVSRSSDGCASSVTNISDSIKKPTPGRHKKFFSFLKKCYKMVTGKK